MPPEIDAIAIPGVGIALSGISGDDLPGYEQLGEEAHGEAQYGYFFDPDDTMRVLQTDIDNQIWEPRSVFARDETGIGIRR